jgi:hypothetical protein
MIDWQTDLEFEDSGLAILEDRRRLSRNAPIAEGIYLWLDESRRLPVELLDTSPNGIGLKIPGDLAFEFGPKIYVDYEMTRRAAVVAHLTLLESGDHRLGLEWL